MAHKNCVIFASLNYMHFGTLSMMFTQEGLLKTAVLKHLSHYTFKCVRIHMRLPIIMTLTNKSSATVVDMQRLESFYTGICHSNKLNFDRNEL